MFIGFCNCWEIESIYRDCVFYVLFLENGFGVFVYGNRMVMGSWGGKIW